ncbi:hypothetical protein [Pseudogemmobacter sp. W21_MBD1_M6]|uniref:hypothetical protein n=1 Tax=Pseudogemmobacter sp. W21_MBD1_M6 TaxID=3240271 RepID=UPI003F94ADB6
MNAAIPKHPRNTHRRTQRIGLMRDRETPLEVRFDVFAFATRHLSHARRQRVKATKADLP